MIWKTLKKGAKTKMDEYYLVGSIILVLLAIVNLMVSHRDLWKTFREHREIIDREVYALTAMAKKRADYVNSQLEVLRSEIHDIHRHLHTDAVNLEYRKFDSEAGDGRGLEQRRPL